MEAGWSRMNDLIVIQASQVGHSIQIEHIPRLKPYNL
jgi:hypothetical protein